MLVSLDEAKRHLRVDGDHEDADIQLKLDAAIEMAIRYVDRDVFATQAEMDAAVDSVDPLLVTPMFKAGVLLYLGDLYANREGAVTGTITQMPTDARACLRPLRRQGV